MKTLIQTLFALMIGVATSCDVVELEQLNSTDDGNGSISEDELQGPTSIPSTQEEVLTLLHDGSTKAWDAEGFTIFGMSGFLPCRLDDEMILSSDGTYAYDGGSTLCGAEDNTRMVEGTWTLSEDLRSIAFTEGELSYTAELIGISADQITLRGDYQGLELNAVYTSN